MAVLTTDCRVFGSIPEMEAIRRNPRLFRLLCARNTGEIAEKAISISLLETNDLKNFLA
jgi:hypothetical protein